MAGTRNQAGLSVHRSYVLTVTRLLSSCSCCCLFSPIVLFAPPCLSLSPLLNRLCALFSQLSSGESEEESSKRGAAEEPRPRPKLSPHTRQARRLRNQYHDFLPASAHAPQVTRPFVSLCHAPSCPPVSRTLLSPCVVSSRLPSASFRVLSLCPSLAPPSSSYSVSIVSKACL